MGVFWEVAEVVEVLDMVGMVLGMAATFEERRRKTRGEKIGWAYQSKGMGYAIMGGKGPIALMSSDEEDLG